MLPKHKAKTGLLQILDKLPRELGFKGYHFFQQRFGKVNLQQQMDSSYASYQTFLKLTKHLEISVKNKSLLEIGSGWLPLLPYFFKYLSEAAKVHTFDLNCHFDGEKIEVLNKEFAHTYRLEVSGADENEYRLPPDIHYFPKTDLTKATLPFADIVFSRFVLEHVYPEDIREMHRKFKEDLPKGTYIIHLISPSDHRAYENKELSLQDFLRYSEEEWDKKQTKFDYHNRLRLPQYIELFGALGLDTVFVDFESPEKDSEAYKKFKKVPVHRDFQQFTEEELIAGSINIVLKT